MIHAGAFVAIKHSGGKNPQAMTILLSRIVPRDQIVAVHAPLVDVDWPDTVEFIRATLPPGVPLILAPVASGKTLLDSIEERIGHTLSPSGRALPELTGIPVPSDDPLDAPPPLRTPRRRPPERDLSDSCLARLRRAPLRME